MGPSAGFALTKTLGNCRLHNGLCSLRRNRKDGRVVVDGPHEKWVSERSGVVEITCEGVEFYMIPARAIDNAAGKT